MHWLLLNKNQESKRFKSNPGTTSYFIVEQKQQSKRFKSKVESKFNLEYLRFQNALTFVEYKDKSKIQMKHTMSIDHEVNFVLKENIFEQFLKSGTVTGRSGMIYRHSIRIRISHTTNSVNKIQRKYWASLNRNQEE